MCGGGGGGGGGGGNHSPTQAQLSAGPYFTFLLVLSDQIADCD